MDGNWEREFGRDRYRNPALLYACDSIEEFKKGADKASRERSRTERNDSQDRRFTELLLYSRSVIAANDEKGTYGEGEGEGEGRKHRRSRPSGLLEQRGIGVDGEGARLGLAQSH